MARSKTPPSQQSSHPWLKKTRVILAVICALVILLPALYLAWLHYNSQQLWQIVSERCVPEQQHSGSSISCLQVNLAQRYTVFNDANGPLHTLLIPIDKITGIESPELLNSKAENYFQHGWDTRYFLQQRAAFPIPERYLALAVNSRYGRTQNQLHLHLSCLKPEVYQAILQQAENIGYQWKKLDTPLSGRRYLAIRAAEATNPFIALAQYLQAEGDAMDNYGLARIVADKGEAILLATRVQLMALTLGTAEELLDFDCKVAQPLKG